MHVKFPVMLSTRGILRPNVTLRFIYINPSQAPHFKVPDAEPGYTGSDSGEHHHRHGGDSGGPPGQSGDGPGAGSGEGRERSVLDMPADERKEVMSEVWLRASLFRDALDQALVSGTTFVYSAANAKLPTVTAMTLPEGMLLGESENRVIVLGVVAGQPAAEAGIVAGDEIRALGTSPEIHSLQEFGHLYSAAQQAQEGTNQSSYSFQVWRPSVGKLLPIVTHKASLNAFEF
jgi:hypothetical protein